MSSNAEKHLTNRLQNNAAVTALVVRRVYPVAAPQDAALPFIVYSRQSTEFVNNAEGYPGTGIAHVSVVSWGSTYQEAKSLADVVRAALNGWRDQGLNPKIDLSSIIDEADTILSPEEGSELPVAYGVVHTIALNFEEN